MHRMSIRKSVSAAIFCAAISVVALGQGATSPSQPQDPTAQAPATTPGGAPPAPELVPPNQSSENKSADSSARRRRAFTGTIVRQEDGYMLRNGDREGQKVKIMGILDAKNALIRVQSIEKSK
jgi:hypothetical protein